MVGFRLDVWCYLVVVQVRTGEWTSSLAGYCKLWLKLVMLTKIRSRSRRAYLPIYVLRTAFSFCDGLRITDGFLTYSLPLLARCRLE